jgi:hypothetical protein
MVVIVGSDVINWPVGVFGGSWAGFICIYDDSWNQYIFIIYWPKI